MKGQGISFRNTIMQKERGAETEEKDAIQERETECEPGRRRDHDIEVGCPSKRASRASLCGSRWYMYG